MENKEEDVQKEENNDLEPTSDTEETENQEESEPLPPYNEVSPAQPKKKRGVSVSSVFMLLVLMALATGGYFFYKQQDMKNQQLKNRIAELEAKFNSIDSDQEARKALKREFMVFKGDTAETLNKQDKAVRAVSGEIIQLRQDMEQLATEQNVEIPEPAEEMDEVAEAIESSKEKIIEESKPDPNAVKRSKETQEYIDLVESTFEKFIRLVKEGSAKLWDYFSGLTEQYTKA
jgi:membrane-associated HD superfamily phosphohydrolase